MPVDPRSTARPVHTVVFSHLADAEATPPAGSPARADQASRQVRFHAPPIAPAHSADTGQL